MKKFTNIDSDIIKENAEIAINFNSNMQEILEKLDKIKVGIDDLALEQIKNPRDYGYIGIIEHINSELDEILDFLG